MIEKKFFKIAVMAFLILTAGSYASDKIKNLKPLIIKKKDLQSYLNDYKMKLLNNKKVDKNSSISHAKKEVSAKKSFSLEEYKKMDFLSALEFFNAKHPFVLSTKTKNSMLKILLLKLKKVKSLEYDFVKKDILSGDKKRINVMIKKLQNHKKDFFNE